MCACDLKPPAIEFNLSGTVERDPRQVPSPRSSVWGKKGTSQIVHDVERRRRPSWMRLRLPTSLYLLVQCKNKALDGNVGPNRPSCCHP
jgi:hypothetical protein